MATPYELQLNNKKFRPNIVIRFLSTYFAIEQPDSGLAISYPYSRVVQGLTVSPTQVDLERATQTIASYSFKLTDKNGVITALVKDKATALRGEQVEIWVGRRTGSFDFSNYFKLPNTFIKKVDHSENAYYISTSDSTDRLTRAIFSITGKLEDAVLPFTNSFTLQDSTASWPTSGMAKIEDEIFSWTGKNDTLRRLTGIVRGELGTEPVSHDATADIFFAHTDTDNPLNILLKLMISGGGGGVYDVYPSGLGISQSLIDIAGIEELRDEIFFDDVFSFNFYQISNALNFIEPEILSPCNVRFVISTDSKISLAILDQSLFGAATNTIDEDTITTYPKWSVDDNDTMNVIQMSWDWDDVLQQFNQVTVRKDADSIAMNGERSPFKVSFKGVKASLNGAAFIEKFSQRYLARFANPTPEISFKTQIDKHLASEGSKVLVISSQIPAVNGTLQFANELEVLSRAINFETGDVSFKLAFTSYTGVRGCFIAPSDIFLTVIDQKTITVPAGRGLQYQTGWKMRLWNIAAIDYTADAVNEIAFIVGDTITFVNNFSTTLTANNFRIKFANYDEITEDQKRYCFISNLGNDFADGKSTYRITF